LPEIDYPHPLGLVPQHALFIVVRRQRSGS
jgi:hypothetical protein